MTARILLILLSLLYISSSFVVGQTIFLREDFKNLNNWEPVHFPKIKKHSAYEAISENGKTYLKAASDASASGLVYKKTFNIYDHPRLRWRWRVDHVYDKGNTREKSGDDYPLRIYVMFQYDSAKAGLPDRVFYGSAKVLYGQYPPHSTLNYVWASREEEEGIITSPYTDRAKIIILQKGKKKLSMWVEESVTILEDYQKAFGQSPPNMASIAIMNDSDNTGGKSVSYIDFIEVE